MKKNQSRPGPAEQKWTREKVKRYLVQRFYTRFHMSLILASGGLAVILAMHGGMHDRWRCFPNAVSMAINE